MTATTTATDPEVRAGRREWLGLAVLALPTLLLSIDVSVLHLAVPHITAGLNASATQMLWIVDSYGFLLAAFLVAMGAIGDRIGRRRLMLIGAACFGVLSVVAAMSVSPAMLIGSRALLGIAAATLMPATLALISNMFANPRQRGVAIAVWVTMFSVGIALGPVVGGAMLEFFWWGSVFLLAVPVMVLLLIAGPALLPEHRNPAGGGLDFVSVALSLAALLPVIYGLKELALHGPGTGPIVAVGMGVLMGALFVRRQRTREHPLLDLALFRHPAFAVALLALLLTMLIAGGTYLFVTQYLQLVADQSPLRAGLWLLPAACALIIACMAAPMAASKIRPGYVVAIGLLVSTAGHVVLATVDSSGGLAQLVIGFTIVYAGGGPVIALGTDLIVGSAPPEQAGAAAAFSETSTELGMALGVALLGSAGFAVYRSQVAVPEEVPAEVAGDTLAEAVVAVDDLPSELSAVVLATARDAFTSGLNLVAGISAVLGLALAFLAARWIRS